MEKEIGKICAEGFSFFGITNRLISHELKNILAIISETLELIDELMELSETGIKIPSGKLRSLSKSVIEEIERANTVIRNMNTFAHSVDEFIKEVDVKEILSLMIKLSRLNAISKNVKIQFLETESHTIYTSPFFLENLLHHAIHFALLSAGPDRHIQVSLHPNDDGIGVVFSGINSSCFESFPTMHTELIAKSIGASISFDISAGKFHVFIPQKMIEGPLQSLRM